MMKIKDAAAAFPLAPGYFERRFMPREAKIYFPFPYSAFPFPFSKRKEDAP